MESGRPARDLTYQQRVAGAAKHVENLYAVDVHHHLIATDDRNPVPVQTKNSCCRSPRLRLSSKSKGDRRQGTRPADRRDTNKPGFGFAPSGRNPT